MNFVAKEKAKKTKRPLIVKPGASQTINNRLIIPATRLMRNITLTNKQQNKLLAKCLYQIDVLEATM